MKPTNKLRFVERDCYIKNGESFNEPFKQKILQQWWTNEYTVNLGWGEIPVGEEKGEWRDVPVEKEQT